MVLYASEVDRHSVRHDAFAIRRMSGFARRVLGSVCIVSVAILSKEYACRYLQELPTLRRSSMKRDGPAVPPSHSRMDRSHAKAR